MKKRKMSLNEINLLVLIVLLVLFAISFIAEEITLWSRVLVLIAGVYYIFKTGVGKKDSKEMGLPADARKTGKSLVEVHIGKKAGGSEHKFIRIVFVTCAKAIEKKCDVVMYFWKYPADSYDSLFNGEAEVEEVKGFERLAQIIFNMHYWKDRIQNKKQGKETLPLLKITLRHKNISEETKEKLNRK